MVIQKNHCFVTYLIMAFCTKHHADIKQVLKYWRRFARNSKYPRSCRPAKMPAQLPISALRSSTSKRGSSTSFFLKGKDKIGQLRASKSTTGGAKGSRGNGAQKLCSSRILPRGRENPSVGESARGNRGGIQDESSIASKKEAAE